MKSPDVVPLPIFLNLANRKVLMVGAGPVALQKLQSLIDTQCEIHVVAKEFSKETFRFVFENKIKYSTKAFEKSDLSGMFLVFVATSDESLNSEIARLAREEKILVNVVDKPAFCDFFSAAVVRRGQIQFAISTNGLLPALASSLRALFERQLPTTLGIEAHRISQIRKRILAENSDPQKRRQLVIALVREFEDSLFGAVKFDQGGTPIDHR